MTGLPRRLAVLISTCVALAAIPAGTSLAAFGDLDPSFDDDGAMFDQLSSDSEPRVRDPRVAQAPDGSLVAAVLSGCSGGCEQYERNFTGVMRVIRVSPSGEVTDTEDLAIADVGELYDLRVLDDGSITIASRNDQRNAHITRLGEDLELDGPPVAYEPDICDGGGRIRDVAIRADGTLAGLWNNCFNAAEGLRGLQNQLIVDEFDAEGGFDDRTDLTNAMDFGRDLALRPDGVIHVLGEIGDGPAVVARLLPEGELDPAYDEDGRAFKSLPFGLEDGPGAFAVDSAGRATFGECCTSNGLRLHRFDADGEADESFGPDGLAVVEGPIRSEDMEFSTQADDKLLVVGNQAFEAQSRGRGSIGITVARVLGDGTGDPEFGTDGFSVVSLDEERIMWPFGPAVQQADGHIVVPVGLEFFGVLARQSVEGPDEPGSYLMLFRLLGDDPPPVTPVTPVTPTQDQQQQQQQQQPGVQQQQQQQPRRCASRRTLRIRLRTGRPKGERSPIVSARVLVRGKRVKVTRRGGRHTALINLRTLPPGRFAVKISLRLADGGKVRETRRYRTCAKKIRRQLKPLRTRAPR